MENYVTFIASCTGKRELIGIHSAIDIDVIYTVEEFFNLFQMDSDMAKKSLWQERLCL